MCGPFWRTVISSRLLSWLVVDGILRRLAPISPAVYTRARFGEDCLEAAIGRGVEQYVIVGAGYETFAMRRQDLMARLTVYELDQPATQESKRQRMRKAGIPMPEGLRYVAADLNAEPLYDALGRAGFDASRRTLFSWFGVTYYLGKDAIRETLESIVGKMAPGSSVMFDYLADPAWTPAAWRGLQERCADFVARRGEPWVSSFDPAEIPDFLDRHRVFGNQQSRTGPDRQRVFRRRSGSRLSSRHRPLPCGHVNGMKLRPESDQLSRSARRVELES